MTAERATHRKDRQTKTSRYYRIRQDRIIGSCFSDCFNVADSIRFVDRTFCRRPVGVCFVQMSLLRAILIFFRWLPLMDIIGIKDSARHLRFAADDLKAVRTAAQLAVEYGEEDGAAETLRVIDRAIESIVTDIEEAVGKIEKCVSDEKGA